MVTLRNIASLPSLQAISVVAGESGLERCITGVNVTESVDLAEFIRPHELIVTTGINMNHNAEELIEMVKSAFYCKAAGIVLNIGPYIPSIPSDILHFANEHQFPIFEMPWRYRIADFIKITVSYLTSAQNLKCDNQQFLTGLLFQDQLDLDEYEAKRAYFGFPSDVGFRVIVCNVDQRIDSIPNVLTLIDESIRMRYKHFLSISYENQIIYMVKERETYQVPLTSLIASLKQKRGDVRLGIGNVYEKLKDVKNSYQEARHVIKLCQNRCSQTIYAYEKMGAYKLLLHLQYRHMAEEYHHEILGPLYRYDRLHQTDYVPFLRIFIEEDGHTSTIGRRNYIHRNTVLYKIKKIESILECSVNTTFIKTNITLAFMIEDMFELHTSLDCAVAQSFL
ncbi:PucR family transcriptional regulator [Ectobacillus sp. sgz5001026]|uniref:PucR family transcriptional regulator n=1 Tax=Ectobacillus sp. sgz5001026 TaxID=3242473 RepID=UPI0036D23156